jgi:hypothetical protein
VKKYYLFFLFLSPIALVAQKKVDLDKYKFTVQYRSLPKVHLDSSYHTFDVKVEGTKQMQPFLQQLSPEKTVTIDGWRKLAYDGHITVKVKLEDLLPESVSVKERVENIKDKSGQVTGTKTFYKQEVVYTFAATADITDYRGVQITNQVLANRNNKLTYNSPEFAIKSLAESYFVLNSFSTTKDLYKNCVTRAMQSLNGRLNNDFGFGEVTVTDYMWIVDSRKHPEYDAHRQAFLQLSEILFAMNANKSIADAREQLKPVIDYFESIKKNYTSTSKHDRKMRYASFFNLAVLYYYLDDPKMMMKEANGLVLNDYDTRDGKAFVQSATWLKNTFEESNIYSRHFAIDPTTFKGPYENNGNTLNSTAN